MEKVLESSALLAYHFQHFLFFQYTQQLQKYCFPFLSVAEKLRNQLNDFLWAVQGLCHKLGYDTVK